MQSRSTRYDPLRNYMQSTTKCNNTRSEPLCSYVLTLRVPKSCLSPTALLSSSSPFPPPLSNKSYWTTPSLTPSHPLYRSCISSSTSSHRIIMKMNVTRRTGVAQYKCKLCFFFLCKICTSRHASVSPLIRKAGLLTLFLLLLLLAS